MTKLRSYKINLPPGLRFLDERTSMLYSSSSTNPPPQKKEKKSEKRNQEKRTSSMPFGLFQCKPNIRMRKPKALAIKKQRAGIINTYSNICNILTNSTFDRWCSVWIH